jgi:porphobilinogen deaminase
MRLVGLVADLEGKRVLRHELEGPLTEPEGLGHRVAASLREMGAQAILDEIRATGAIMPAPAP